MTQWSDCHNFGRTVTLLENGEGSFFIKHRSCVWENFFFGCNSPLLPLLSKSNKLNLKEILFGLEFKSIEAHKSIVRKVESTTLERIPETFYNFGVLLGYCYAFGIFDIHRENIVPSGKTFIQVIDAEVVLGKMTLPQETLLLPFKDLGFNNSALSLISDSSYLSSCNLVPLLNGFIDITQIIAALADNVCEEISKLVTGKNPIRVIFRRTPNYVSHINKTLLIPDLCYEEAIQLDRNDVPYFFIKRPSAELLYYIDSSWNEMKTGSLVQYNEILNRMNVPIKNMINKQTILTEKLPHGLLHILKKHCIETDLRFQYESVGISKNGRNMKVTIEGNSYEAST